jgi:hypothetical protein
VVVGYGHSWRDGLFTQWTGNGLWLETRSRQKPNKNSYF